MPKLKTFIGSTVVLPHIWVRKVNTKTHHIQGHIVIVAATKAAAEKMLVEAGAGDVTAKAIVRECRVADPDRLPRSEQALIAAGVLDLGEPGAYVWRDGQDGGPIVRADNPAAPVVGIFRLVTRIEDGRNAYETIVEPFTETPAEAPVKERITWITSRYGSLRGQVGGIEMFSLDSSTTRGDNSWHLRADFGSVRHDRRVESTDEGKGLAEQMLVEFVTAIGAAFPS